MEIFNKLPEGVIISHGKAEDFEIICSNKTIHTLLDVREEDSIGMLRLKDKLRNVNTVNNECSLLEKLSSENTPDFAVNIKIPTDIAKERSYEARCTNILIEQKNCKLTIIKDQTDYEELTKERMIEKFQKVLIASVTHEIRTPLNIQMGMLEMIADNKNKANVDEYIDIAKKNLQLLTYLVQPYTRFVTFRP